LTNFICDAFVKLGGGIYCMGVILTASEAQ